MSLVVREVVLPEGVGYLHDSHLGRLQYLHMKYIYYVESLYLQILIVPMCENRPMKDYHMLPMKNFS